MANALRNYANRPIGQTEQANPRQVKNNTGGYVYAVSDKSRLERFLILGTDGGTYYVSEQDLTKQNVDFLRDLIQKDEALVLNTTIEISKAGRAYRNDAAIFVMAMLLAEGKNKSATVASVPDVVRIGTHVYSLAGYISALGGWGRAKRAAIANWFTSQRPEDLAYQSVKYRQRNGWTMRDLMRKSHPVGVNQSVGNFILKGETDWSDMDILYGFNYMQKATTIEGPEGVLGILQAYPNLPWETIPTQFLKDKRVWERLYYNGQLKGQALVRNVTRLAKLDMFSDMLFAQEFAGALTSEEMIRKTRLHPMQYLNAYVVYTEGQGKASGYSVTREKSWNVSPLIKDALDDGFQLSFKNVEPAGKRTMISIDTSGSMGWYLAGNTQLTAFQGAGAMAMITARTEPLYIVNAFSSTMKQVDISGRDSLQEATRKLEKSFGGGTNCALPMQYAAKSKIEIDTFVVITDNETWQGGIHADEALRDYRKKMGINAKLVVMAMVPTAFSIADPLDPGMLDVVGFDSNTPKALADFSAGRI
jgi:60 kDa SS-A/Ro ribonucleoprotein